MFVCFIYNMHISRENYLIWGILWCATSERIWIHCSADAEHRKNVWLHYLVKLSEWLTQKRKINWPNKYGIFRPKSFWSRIPLLSQFFDIRYNFLFSQRFKVHSNSWNSISRQNSNLSLKSEKINHIMCQFDSYFT